MTISNNFLSTVYSIIYPYISYAIVTWGSTSKKIYKKYKLSKIMLLG